MRMYIVPALLTHSCRTGLFLPRARTVSSERGGRLRVEEVKEGRGRKWRGRGRRRERVWPMVGMSQVDLDLIDIILLYFSGEILRSQMCSAQRSIPYMRRSQV